MTDLPAVLGVGGTFQVNGRELRWSPMTLGDEAEFEQLIRGQLGNRTNVLERLRPEIEKIADPGDRRAAYDSAIKEHLRIERMRGIELAQQFGGADVETLLFWFHLRRQQPTLTVAEVREMMTLDACVAVLDMIQDQLRMAHPGKGRSPNSGGDSESTTPETTTETPKVAGTGARSPGGTS